MADYEDDAEAEDEEMFTGKYEGGRNERNERHGFGKAVLPNKDIYEGNYMNGKRDGYGVYKFTSKAAKGSRYMGEFYQGRKHGYGVFIYPDGSKYEGSWLDDMREGQGTYTYVNGDTYHGDWLQNRRHGNGTYTYKRGSLKYVGGWHKGKYHGYGTFVYPYYNYSGRFRSNKAFGHGKYVFDTRCEMHGKFTLFNTPVGFSDMEQEAALLAVEQALVGGGEDDDHVNLEDIIIPGTPPPIEGETKWKYAQTTGLQVMTPEEAEEAKLVEELIRLRKKLESQLNDAKEKEKKKVEKEAAELARVEAERAALENMTQDIAGGGEGEGEDGAFEDPGEPDIDGGDGGGAGVVEGAENDEEGD